MFNPLDFTGRTFLVTGASSGIGRETATLLSRLGATLVLVGRNEARLDETRSGLEGTGHHALVKDLKTLDEIPAWLGATVKSTGPLDGLVHCAGIHSLQPLKLVKQERIDQIFQINVSAALTLAKAYRQPGVSSGFKSIVLISSVAGLVGQAGLSIYSASKGAVISLTKSLALELAPEGIRVNCIAPGLVDTEMTAGMQRSLSSQRISEIIGLHPLGLGKPLDVAYAAAFLLGETARWITGSTLVVDGGFIAA